MKNKDQKLGKNFISAVVYVHNAQDFLKPFLKCVTQFMEESFLKYEFIFVNDASTDRSTELIKDYFKDRKRGMASVLNMSFYQGMEASMRAGMDLAIGDFIYEFDSAILSYPPGMLKDVYEKCVGDGYDIVSACPMNAKHMCSNLFYSVYNKYSDSQNTLRSEAFRILSRRAVNRVCSMSRTIPYRKAVYAGCGLPSCAIFYTMTNHFSTSGKKERTMQWNAAVDALMLYTDAAYKFALCFSMLMIIFSIFVCIYIAAVFIAGKPVPGYVSTIAAIGFGFFGIFVFLTILIKYASLILRIVFARHKYMTESVEKL